MIHFVFLSPLVGLYNFCTAWQVKAATIILWSPKVSFSFSWYPAQVCSLIHLPVQSADAISAPAQLIFSCTLCLALYTRVTYSTKRNHCPVREQLPPWRSSQVPLPQLWATRDNRRLPFWSAHLLWASEIQVQILAGSSHCRTSP